MPQAPCPRVLPPGGCPRLLVDNTAQGSRKIFCILFTPESIFMALLQGRSVGRVFSMTIGPSRFSAESPRNPRGDVSFFLFARLYLSLFQEAFFHPHPTPRPLSRAVLSCRSSRFFFRNMLIFSISLLLRRMGCLPVR